MKLRRLVQRLGTRLFLSYALASLAAAVTGLAAAFLSPAQTYQALMLAVMHPAPGTTTAQMDALLAGAIAQAVAWHVALSLGVAILVSVLAAAYVSRQIGAALSRVIGATRDLADGNFSRRLPPEDIDEISRLSYDVNRLAESLELSEQRRSLAIASVGHELRTPLTALRAYLDGLREGVLEATPDVVERMAQGVARLERMAQDLSSLARAEAGGVQPVSLAPVSVRGALAGAYGGMQLAYAEKGVYLVLETQGDEDVLVLADETRLGEVLENLLANSLVHTPKGRSVRVGCRPGEADVELFVSDEGRGILPEDLPHVTEPFFRGDGGTGGRTPRAGMGLGLAISRRLAQAMGGGLTLESPGRGLGTTARLRLSRVLRRS